MTGITPVTPVVEMLIGGVWTDITADVRLSSAHSGGGIRITRGVPNEGSIADPTEVSFVLDNTGGKYSPKNELSVNYGKLGRNTPVRFALSRRQDDFIHTEVDNWGRLPSWTDSENKTILGEKWRITGAGSRFDMSGGTATIAAGAGISAATFGTYGDVEVITKVKVSNLTSEFGIMLRLDDPALDEQDWESGLGSWTAGGGTIAISSVQVHAGTQSALLTTSGSPAQTTTRGASVLVTPGRAYRGVMWVRCSVARTITGVIDWYDQNLNLISSGTSGVAVAANTWTLIEVDSTAPDTAYYAQYGPTVGSSPANGTLLFVDDLALVETTLFDAYTAYITPGSPDLLRLGTLTHDGGALASSVSLGTSIVAGDYWWMKAQINGIRRRVKWWKDGTAEPSTWGVRQARTNQDSGKVFPPKVGMVGLYAQGGSAVVTFDSIQVNVWRAHAEITQLPPRWDLSRQDQWAPITAKGITRRLGQGRKALESSTTLYLKGYTASKTWAPLEAFESGAISVPNLVAGAPVPIARNLTLAAPDTTGTLALPGIAGYADFDQDTSFLQVGAAPGAAAGVWSYLNFIRIPNAPASDILMYKVETSGTAAYFLIYHQPDRGVRVEARTRTDVLLSSSVAAMYNGTADLPYGCWLAANLYVYDSGGTVSWAWNYHRPGSTVFLTCNGTFAGSAGIFSRATYQSSSVHTAAGNMQVTQSFHYPGDLPFVTSAFARAAYAYIGEEAIVRWERIADSQFIPHSTIGVTTGSKELGAQTPSKALDLMQEAAQLDYSDMYEERDDFAINLHTRDAMWNQRPVELDIDLGHLTEPLEPVDDDQLTRNDITVSRPEGGFARSVQLTGPLNVNEPEVDASGVGVYDEASSLNYRSDDLLQAVADWKRSRGTLDVIRYPNMMANLNSECYDSDPKLAMALLSCDIGDLLKVTNREVSREPTYQWIRSYEETIDQYDYTLSFVTQPGDMLRVGVVGYSTRAQTYRQTLQSSFIAGTDTKLQSITAAGGALWVTVQDSPESFPFDIMIQGCRLRVVATGNLINSNPFLKTGITGWTATGGTLIWDRSLNTGRYDGQATGRVANTSGGSATLVAKNPSAVGTITPGQVYQASTWLRVTNTSADCGVNLNWYSSTGTLLGSIGGSTATQTAANGWVHYAKTGTAPASASYAEVVPYAVLASGEKVNFVDARLMHLGSSAASPQTLTVEQAPVYGVTKTLTAGASITVADPWRVAL
jgi:hypothetical protein